MIVSSNLRAFRAKHSKTQGDMANLLGISVLAYRQKENNNRPFTLDEAKQIAELFKLPIESIFFDDKVHINGTPA